MKRLLITGIAAAMFLSISGCRNELIEISPDNEITFDAFLNNITRTGNVEQIDRFYVYGVKTDAEEQSVLFDRQEVIRENGELTYAPVEYWQKNATYHFTGILPESGNWNLEDYNEEIGTCRGKLFFDNMKAQGREDLSVAIAMPIQVTEPSIQDEVHFDFRHQLSGIYFRFQNAYPANAAYRIKIKDVILEDIETSASMELTSEDAPWIPEKTKDSFTFSLDKTLSLRPGTDDIIRTEKRYIFPGNGEKHLQFTIELYLNEGKDLMTSYSHRITLPSIDIKKGYCYDIKAMINEFNTDPENMIEPMTVIVNEIERWDESPETGEGGI